MTDHLYLSWRGVDDDAGIWFSNMVQDPVGPGSNQMMIWTPERAISNVGTFTAPALASLPGTSSGLLMAWRGVQWDRGIWYSTFDGNGWSPQINIPGIGTSTGPALALYRDKVHMVWKGVESDNNIWHAAYNPRADEWSGFVNSVQDVVPGAATYTAPALAVFRDQLHMVWRGVITDHKLYHAVFDWTSGWSDVEVINFPNVGCSVAPALAAYNGRLHMVWNGWDDLGPTGYARQRLWHTTFDGSHWAQGEDLNSFSAAAPAMAVANGRLYLVWRGAVVIYSLGTGQGYQDLPELVDQNGKAYRGPDAQKDDNDLSDSGDSVSMGNSGLLQQDQSLRLRHYNLDRWDDTRYWFSDRASLTGPALAVRTSQDAPQGSRQRTGGFPLPLPVPNPRSSRLPFDIPPVIPSKPPVHG
jgi:hypothetical protein